LFWQNACLANGTKRNIWIVGYVVNFVAF